MNDAKWQKYAVIGGPLFVVLAIVGGFLPGSPPKPNANVDKITKFFTEKDTQIQVGAWLGLLGAVALVWWFATLWRGMSAAEGGRPRLAVASLAGLVFAGAIYGISSALFSGTAIRSADLGDNASVLRGIYCAMAGAGCIAVAIHVFATTALGFRSGFLPVWVNVLGVLAALANLVGSIGIATDSTAIFAVGIIAFFTWALWILVVSLVLWRAESAHGAMEAQVLASA